MLLTEAVAVQREPVVKLHGRMPSPSDGTAQLAIKGQTARDITAMRAERNSHTAKAWMGERFAYSVSGRLRDRRRAVNLSSPWAVAR
jgi:hypothetical protein